MKVCKWVMKLEERLDTMRKVAKEKMIQAKETFKSEYDKAAKARLFVEGDMVWLRIPSLVRTHGMVRRGFSLV